MVEDERNPDPDSADDIFDIEWMDEAALASEDVLFSEPGPEPPPQSFEILDWPRAEELPDSGEQGFQCDDTQVGQAGLTGHSSPQAFASKSSTISVPCPVSSGREQVRDASSTGNDRHAVHQRRPPMPVRLVWSFMPILLFTAGYATVSFTQNGVGYAWDEAYYYEPSLLAAEWLAGFLKGENRDAGSIDKYWSKRSEHPSVMKLSSAVSIMFFPLFLPGFFMGEESHLIVMRMPGAIFFGISLSLLYLLGRRAWGPVPGLISALLFLTMPRVFGHAHFASMEMPLICMMLTVVFCFLRGLDSPFWAILTGIFFGLLLATKINGFFLPLPLLLWSHLYAGNRYLNNLVSMLILGPVVMFLAWPWLWHDPLNRLLEYLLFHVNHQQTALFFQGIKWGYGGANAPWYYPLMMLLVSLPLVHILVIIIGIIRNFWKPHHRPYSSLFLMCILFMLLVACLPSTPKYDGVRLFLPVFPFLALMGGAGSLFMIQFVTVLTHGHYLKNPVRQHHLMRGVAVGISLAVLVSGALATVAVHPYYLSYFNRMTGGLRGAAKKGFEVTYWGEAFNHEVIEYLNNLPFNPDGSSPRIMARAFHQLCLEHLQQWGILSDALRVIGPGQGLADYHVLLMRRSFWSVDDLLLTRYASPIRSWEHEGIPLIAVYQTGSDFERFRIEQKTRMPQVDTSC